MHNANKKVIFLSKDDTVNELNDLLTVMVKLSQEEDMRELQRSQKNSIQSSARCSL